MMKTISFALVLILSLATMSLAVEYTWAQKLDMPTARFCHSASVVDGKIYVIGGAAKDMTEAIFPVEVYDPIMDEWTTEANIPAPRVAHSASVVDGKIYTIGGAESPTVLLSTVLEYDPATNTWTTKSDMPTARWMLSTSVVDGKIYAIGGWSSLTAPVGLSSVEVYDPVTDTWTPKTPMPFGVWGLCTAVVDGKIYALGGRPARTAIPYVQEYDPATDTWTRKSDMPVGTSQMGSVVLGDKIIVIAGWQSSGNYPYTAVQMYDPKTDIWTIEGDAPFLRAAFSASVVNNRIYAIGGTDRPHPCPATSTVYELTVSGPPPDFNGDGIVDSVDVCMMIDYWGTNEALYDIAPAPFGDGIVDVQDLVVLAGHLFEGAGLVAHWSLDEIEGDVAYDSAGNIDATVHNGQWTDGRIKGALDFNGLTTYMDCGDSLRLNTRKMTLAMWLEPQHMGGMRYILSRVKERSVDFDYVIMRHRYGEVEFAVAQEGSEPVSVMSYATTPLDEWTHVAVCLNGSEATIYINGRPDASTGYAQRSSHEDCRLWISSLGGDTRFYNGKIDDIRIYNIALNDEQIAALVQ